MAIIIIGVILVLFAAFIQGFTSFGFAMILIPLLTLFLPLKTVAPVLVIYPLIINSLIVYKVKKHLQIKKMLFLIMAGVITTPLGTYLLLVIEEDILKVMVGIIIFIAAWALSSGYKVNIKNEKLAHLVTGLLSGVLNGSLTMGGPPVILLLKNEDVEKEIFRANLSFYFGIIGVTTIPVYFYGGLITEEVIKYTLLWLPSLIIGALAGIYFASKVNSDIFKRYTLYLIGMMGLLSIVSGIN